MPGAALPPQPRGHPGPGRYCRQRLGERPSGTRPFPASPAALAPDQPHRRVPVRDVPRPGHRVAALHRRRDHPARWAPRRALARPRAAERLTSFQVPGHGEVPSWSVVVNNEVGDDVNGPRAALKRVTVPPGPRGTRTRLERGVTGPPTSTPTSHGRFSLGCVGHPIAAAAALPRPPRPHPVDNQTPVWVVGRIIDAVTRRKAAVVASGARSRHSRRGLS